MDYDTKNDVINEKGQGKIFMIYEQKKKKPLKNQYVECQLIITKKKKITHQRNLLIKKS